MRRTLLVVPLLLMVLVVSGCGDKSPQNASAVTNPSQSATESTSPSGSSVAMVGEKDFCDNIVAVFDHADSTTAPTDPLNDLLADGVPSEMPSDAMGGVQILIDNAQKMQEPKDAFALYQNLSSQDRASVNALVTYIASACGQGLLEGLLAQLPSTVPEGLKSLSPSDLPSELRDMLPSELPSSLNGIVPENLASMIPEEWRSLIPEEYQGIFESPAPAASPTP